ncbi:tetratricopeptide repeat protein [Polaromonas sp.]|uniref:tetratricopeptide repeat protein n=1 Tax=Polaromonas sp. TaxID=1869339 RepID=UPI003CB58636
MSAVKGWSMALMAIMTINPCNAWASGSEESSDMFVDRRATDIELSRYDKGSLGVILPSYPRAYLYPAWRAIVLGSDGLKAHPPAQNGLREAIGIHEGNWVDEKHPLKQWQDESTKVLQQQIRLDATVFRSVSKGYSYYLNCPRPAFLFAIKNLATLKTRPDATSGRLQQWVSAQNSVFDFCDYDVRAMSYGARPNRLAPEMPKPLAATEPRYWRQMRDYQIATALFYNESYTESRRAFNVIAITHDHPMQRWGAYLALRSSIRIITMEAEGDWDIQLKSLPEGTAGNKRMGTAVFGERRVVGTPPDILAPVIAQARRILADPSLQHVHDATRASVRTAQYRLTPLDRLYELSERLDDTAQDPHRESTLGDWRRLMNDLFNGVDAQRGEKVGSDLRQRFAYFDWIRSLQDCGLATENVRAACAAASARVLKRLEEAPGPAQRPGERRAWMLAALMLSDKASPQLERFALDVPPTAPEYLTARYHLARLYRIAGQPAQAREVSQAALESPQFALAQSNSAAILFQQERLASARSLSDAASYLTRKSEWVTDLDTGETLPAKDTPYSTRLAADGLVWLNTRLSVSDLFTLARSRGLPESTKGAVVTSAWMRADFLGQTDIANQSAELAKQWPGLRDTAIAYLAAPNAGDKRHILILNSLRHGLSPSLNTYVPDYTQSLTPLSPEMQINTVASMWCAVSIPKPAPPDPWNPWIEQVPPPPDLSADAGARDREISELAKIGTATGFVGAHVLNRAKTHPSDPDLPWLLYVVVQSTRGGCVDAGNSKLSRTAYTILHTRFKNSPWTLRTSSWY